MNKLLNQSSKLFINYLDILPIPLLIRFSTSSTFTKFASPCILCFKTEHAVANSQVY